MTPFCVTCLIASTVVSGADEVTLSVVKQESTSHRNTLLMLQPFSLLSNWVIVTVESAFSDKLSGVISLGGAYRNTTQNAQQPDAGSWSTTDRTISASIEPGFNYYFQGRAPQGFWLGPRLVFEFQWSQLIANFSPALGDVSNSSNTWRDYTVGG